MIADPVLSQCDLGLRRRRRESERNRRTRQNTTRRVGTWEGSSELAFFYIRDIRQ